jgi:serine/threonine-protein kinase
MTRTLGTYERLVFLGEGGMAEVWLARQHRAEGVQRQVVLKHLRESLANDRDHVLAFLDEARLLARLSHPSVVQLFDLEILDDVYAMVLEHVDGVDLGELVKSARPGHLADPIAFRIALSLAEALAYVHASADELGDPLGIVHRDVNPRNVLVGKNGAVKLIDFGIATATIHEHRTRTGVLKGTSGYVAPEQISDDPKVDARADVFSLGAVLYELFTGTPAFAAPGGLADARSTGAHAPLRSARPDLDEQMAAIVERCLERDRTKRFEDGGAVLRALSATSMRPCTLPELGALVAAAASDRPTEVVRQMPTVSVQRPSRPAPRARPRALTGLAALVLVITVAAIAYFVGQWLAS